MNDCDLRDVAAADSHGAKRDRPSNSFMRPAARNANTTGSKFSLMGLLITLGLLIVSAPAFAAEEEELADPYRAVWTTLAEHLRKREYGLAIAVLDSAANEAELQTYAQQIEADKSVIAGLQSLQLIVAEQAAKLPAGTPLKIAGIEYVLVRHEQDAAGDELVLKSKSSGKQSRKLVAGLPSATCLELAKSQQGSLKYPSLIQGVFAGFDQTADIKAARRLLNQAADEGADVTPWLARLKELEESRKRPGTKTSGGKDPIVGKWRLKHENGLEINVEFRADGTLVNTIPPTTLVEMRKRRMPPPQSNPSKGSWAKEEGSIYRFTGPAGFTGMMLVIGDRLSAKNPDGKVVFRGLRQVEK